MNTTEYYTTGIKGRKDKPAKRATDKEIENLVNKVGLNKNGNKCRLEKKLIIEIEDLSKLSFDESDIGEAALKNLLTMTGREEKFELEVTVF